MTAPREGVIVETERLTIRRMTAEDAAFMLALLNDPDFISYIGDRGVRTLMDACAYIEHGPLASYERFGFGLWVVELTSTGESIGICGVLHRDELPHPDLGFAFLPAYRAHGYALEAADAVRTYARDVLHLPRLLAITSRANDRSIRLLAKIGFAYQERVRLTPHGDELNLFATDLSDA